MLLNKLSKMSYSVAALSLLLSPLVATSSGSDHQESSDEFFQAVEQFQRTHPGDFVGLRDLVESYGGTFSVSTNVTGQTTAEDASAAYASMDATPADGSISPMSIPSNAFVVAVLSSRPPGSTVANVTGTWNWRDDFVGQGDPFDIAALYFSQGCGLFSGYTASTRTWDNISTNKATLRSAGVGTAGPAWNIDAYTSGFVNTADHGYVSVNYDTAPCSGSVQAAFAYEGNQGGSILSVAVSWLGLSVSYSGAPSTLLKSSGATTI